jgi:hypothetical protein
MYTFTFYHNQPPIAVWRDASKAWNIFRTAAVKKYGGFSYARILEHHHKSPYPHYHVIADVEFGAVWFAKELKNAAFGYQAKITRITSEQAGIYVTKYLTKPWSDQGCKAIRKILRLRIVAFGGSACSRVRTGEPWVFVTRDISRDQNVAKCDIDRSWSYGNSIKLFDKRVQDAFTEEIYSLPYEDLIVEGVIHGPPLPQTV